MDTKFLFAGIAGFIVSMGFGFVFHGLVLHNDYGQLPNLFRPEEDAMGYFPFMLASHLIKGFAFAWVYQRGISNAPWLGQGVRYGIAMALLVTIPLYLVYYAVQPMPGMLVAKQIIFDSIGTILMGVVVAFICKPAQSK